MFKKTQVLNCELRKKMHDVIPHHLHEFKLVKEKYGERIMGEVKVNQVLGGMRGINGLFYESSKLDAEKGILLKGRNLFDLVKSLKYMNGKEPLPESLIWYMFTGEIPNDSQVKTVIDGLNCRAQNMLKTKFQQTENLLKNLDKSVHPMTQLSMAVLSLQSSSQFAEAYRNGVNKKHYWESYYEDSMNLISVLPRIASLIYNNVFFNGRKTPDLDTNMSYAENFANMLGYSKNREVFDYLCHYLVLHSDHEGGNVSAHASCLVSSALSDPFYSYSAGLNG